MLHLSPYETEAFFLGEGQYNYSAILNFFNIKESRAQLKQKLVPDFSKVTLPEISGEDFIKKYYEFGKFTYVCQWIPYLATTHGVFITRSNLYTAVSKHHPEKVIYGRDYFNQAQSYSREPEVSSNDV